MSSDEETRPEMPAQPKTRELPAADRTEIQINEIKVLMLKGMGELDVKMALGFKAIMGDVADLSRRLIYVEDWKSESEARMTKTSLAVRGASQVDLAHEAQLAHERDAREALATKVDELAKTNETQLAILGRLDKVASNPLVKTVAAMLATALVTWLASHGVHP